MQKFDYSTRQTAQSEPIPGKDMTENSAGGYAFAVDDWGRLDRFLVLGTGGGTYYATEQKLTLENAECVRRCIDEDGPRTVARIVELTDRVPKNDPSLFALAMCSAMGDRLTRTEALKALPKIARIGTHLFMFAAYREQFGGWGRSMRNAVRSWYNDRSPDALAYQAIKYQQRDGWSHRDLLRLSHPKSDTNNTVYRFIVKGEIGAENDLPEIIKGFLQAQEAPTNELPQLIRDYGLTREMVPTEALNDIAVWEALLERMPMTAMLRNLGKMANIGLLKPMSEAVSQVCARITDAEALRKARIHPIAVLSALTIYGQGHGARGSLSWSPDRAVMDALDEAFYLSFGNVEPTGKRIMLALDVSGSMGGGLIAGVPGLTPRLGSAAMSMVTARTESQWHCVGFTSATGRSFGRTALMPLDISPRQRLDDVVHAVSRLPFGGTDCALPMLYALENELSVHAFVVYTDSETWAGGIHPSQALEQYRRETGIPAKLIVVGMTSNGFSIADPTDAGMMDVVGFDSAAPNVMSDFIRT